MGHSGTTISGVGATQCSVAAIDDIGAEGRLVAVRQSGLGSAALTAGRRLATTNKSLETLCRRCLRRSAGIIDPPSRQLALAARPLQKHFACRQQFTATQQFDTGVWFRRDSKRVRISVSAQRLPNIQLRRSAIKYRADDVSQTLFGLGEEQRNKTFTRLLQDNNAKCCLSHRALAAWRARREPGTSQQREPFVRIRQTLKVTPAMAAAVTSRICEMGRRARMSLSNKTALAMIFKLAEAAER